MVKTLKIGVSSDLVKLVSDVGTLKINQKKLEEETKANSSQLAESVSTQLHSVRYAMDVTNNNTWTKIKTVQSSVDTLNTDRNTTTFQLSSLQSSVNTLTSRVNSPVNLYQNCTEETASCVIPPTSTHYYWRQCFTTALPINRAGYHTLGMRCEYEINSLPFFESTVFRKFGSSVRCQCDLTWPVPTSNTHYSLWGPLRATCTMFVTRCPLQQNIY